jgi:hypothetical protein
MKKRDHVEERGGKGRRINLILEKEYARVWVGFIWLKVRTCSGLL